MTGDVAHPRALLSALALELIVSERACWDCKLSWLSLITGSEGLWLQVTSNFCFQRMYLGDGWGFLKPCCKVSDLWFLGKKRCQMTLCSV